ncbi:MAG: molybdate ABC transporter substrate-binding protein [Cyanobacteriota bacterium]|nr:molybdate ABC transporter substrate-binding protein [Cyanobacteriota bacterium]
MNRRLFYQFALLSCLAFFGCSRQSAAPEGDFPVTITVSAAASLQDALGAIEPQFREAHPEIEVTYNFASSGALQRQIEQGAPADVFFSAATQQMDALEEKELILAESRADIVANRLVVIAAPNTSLAIASLAELKDSDIQRFAVGEFRSVPAGQYAEQALKTFDLVGDLQAKFVFGNNVRTVLSAVESGNADVGMVYATDAALSQRISVLAQAPSDSHSPIQYPVAIVANSDRTEAAQTWIAFLQTETAQSTFTDFGFDRISQP